VRSRLGWNFWLIVVIWAVVAALLFPSVVHRLADRDGFWNGGFIQGTGLLYIALRFAQAALEAAVLGAIYGFLGFFALFGVVMLLGGVALLLKGKAKLGELISLPPRRSLAEWTLIACFVVLSTALFRLFTHWVLWSNYAVIHSWGLALLSIAGPAWLLALLWLVYKPAGRG
jgi:hypothetical protein